MKKIKFLIFLMIIYLISTSSIYALTCSYGSGHKSFDVVYSDDTLKLDKIYFSNDYVSDEDQTETYREWFDVELTKRECPTITVEGVSITSFGEEEDLWKSEADKDLGSCAGYTDEFSCQENKFYSCIWNVNEFDKKGYCNTDKLIYIRCGGSFDIPYQAPKIISFIITLLKTSIPIILIFVSLVSLLKSLGAPNEDEIKKAQKSFVRKITAAILAFLVITIVQFVIRKVADSSDSSAVSTCLSCFMNNDCDGAAYYKTNVGGTYLCTELSGSKKTFTCPGNK